MTSKKPTPWWSQLWKCLRGSNPSNRKYRRRLGGSWYEVAYLLESGQPHSEWTQSPACDAIVINVEHDEH